MQYTKVTEEERRARRRVWAEEKMPDTVAPMHSIPQSRKEVVRIKVGPPASGRKQPLHRPVAKAKLAMASIRPVSITIGLRKPNPTPTTLALPLQSHSPVGLSERHPTAINTSRAAGWTLGIESLMPQARRVGRPPVCFGKGVVMKRSLVLLACALLALPGIAAAQNSFGITGGLSNFDVPNHCDHECDEFEVEIEDCGPGDVVHTYHNGNYGSPTVTRGASGTSTIIDYRNPGHLTIVNSIEHFGISLRQFNPTNIIRVRWMRSGRSATVNGQVPNPNGSGASTHASQPIMPIISADMGLGSTGGGGVACTVTNNDATQPMWIKRRGTVYQSVVTLEALMPTNPTVLLSVPLDASPIYLAPGQSLTVMNDLVEVEDNQSVVFAAEFYQDIFVSGGIFGSSSHAVGAMLGNVMTAAIASPGTGCDQSRPVILVQPHDITVALNHSADISVNADGNDLTLSYQWMRDGVALTNGGNFHSVTSDSLSIDQVNATSEGFYSCKVSNVCGFVYTSSALVFVTGHNNPPARPATGSCCDSAGGCTFVEQAGCNSANTWSSASTCTPNACGTSTPTGACCNGTSCTQIDPGNCLGSYFGNGTTCSPTSCCTADFNQSGAADVQDIFSFLSGWFSADPRADINGVGGLNVQDIFDFLSAWFAGC